MDDRSQSYARQTLPVTSGLIRHLSCTCLGQIRRIENERRSVCDSFPNLMWHSSAQCRHPIDKRRHTNEKNKNPIDERVRLGIHATHAMSYGLLKVARLVHDHPYLRLLDSYKLFCKTGIELLHELYFTCKPCRQW